MARIKKNPEVIEENIQETPEQLPAEKPTIRHYQN
jgi:hypothetical protein